MSAQAWVRRLLPLDSVEGAYHDIWHSRDIAGYEGLREAFDEGLKGDVVSSEPLSLGTLEAIGEAVDEITVDAIGAPQEPPVDPEPWTPSPAGELLEELEELEDI
jgi:hypothetical protein